MVEPIKYTLFKDGEPFMEAEAGGQAEECEVENEEDEDENEDESERTDN